MSVDPANRSIFTTAMVATLAMAGALLMAGALATQPAAGQSVEAGKQSALDHAIALEELVGEMSSRLWDFAEIALEEHQSAA